MIKQILTFTVGKEIFGVDISEVNEIIRADYHVTPIPNKSNGYIGMFQPRENIITAIDLNYFLFGNVNCNIKESKENILHNKYYIMRNNYAWFIDEVEDIIEFEEEKMISPSKILSGKNYIIGIYKNNDKLIQIIDFDSIIK